jgi:hypothetical protein
MKNRKTNTENAYNTAIALGWFGLTVGFLGPVLLEFISTRTISFLVIGLSLLNGAIGYLLLRKGKDLKEAFILQKNLKKKISTLKKYAIAFAIIAILLVNPIYGIFQLLIVFYCYKGIKELETVI